MRSSSTLSAMSKISARAIMEDFDDILSELKKTDVKKSKLKEVKEDVKELKEIKKKVETDKTADATDRKELERKKAKLEAKLMKLEKESAPVVEKKEVPTKKEESVQLTQQDGAVIIKKKRKGTKKELLESDLLSLDEKNQIRHENFYAPREERKNVAENVKDKILKNMKANDYKTATFVGKIGGGRRVLECPECSARLITAGIRAPRKKIDPENRSVKQQGWIDYLAAVRKLPAFKGMSAPKIAQAAGNLRGKGYTYDDLIGMIKEGQKEESSSEE